MKHFFFKKAVLILFVLTASVLWGQPSRVTSFGLDEPIEKTIVREYIALHPVTISYVETSTEHLFVYNDGYLNLTPVSIDTNYSVNDFVILDDSVYFCGEGPNGGFFGQFDIYDYYSVNQGYEVSTAVLPTALGHVQTLNRLVAFDNASGRELVAIGRSATGISCVAEAQYNTTLSTWSYRVGELPPTSYDDLLDLTQTQDFVVVAGYRPNTPQVICVRLFNKHDVFSGLQDSSFGFYHECSFDTSQMIVSPVQGNMFLVTSYWRTTQINAQPLSNNEGTAIGYYTAVNSTNTHVQHGATSIVYQPYLNGDWKLRGMTQPRSTADCFFLLQDAEVNGVSMTVSMVFDMDYNLFNPFTNSIAISYAQDAHYQSIDSYGVVSQYMMNGINDIANTKLTFCESIAGQYPCLQDSILSKDNLTTVLARHTVESFTPTGGSMAFHTLYGTKKQLVKGIILCD